MDAIGFYQENRDHDESVYHKMERAHAINDRDILQQDYNDHVNEQILPVLPEYKVRLYIYICVFLILTHGLFN